MVKKYSELYAEARKAIMQQEDAHTASLYARNLLCCISGKGQEAIVADREMYASESICKQMEEAVGRVISGEPLAYVLGEWDFYGLTLKVTPDVLIPRDDTCAVTALALEQALFLGTAPRILDLCTGSGCIGLAIASRMHDAKVTLADISREALSVAKTNISRLKLSGRVACVNADALGKPSTFLGKFDMIVSNPPYITTREMLMLPDSVKKYEPRIALHGGTDGLDFYRSIAQNYCEALKPGGYLCFEFGMGQGDAICQILQESGYTILQRAKDYQNIERAVIARYNRKED